MTAYGTAELTAKTNKTTNAFIVKTPPLLSPKYLKKYTGTPTGGRIAANILKTPTEPMSFSTAWCPHHAKIKNIIRKLCATAIPRASSVPCG